MKKISHRHTRKASHKRLKKQLLINGLLVVGAIAFLSLLAVLGDILSSQNGTMRSQNDSVINSTISSIRLEVPLLTDEQYLVGTGVIAYMESDLSEDASKVMAEYRSKDVRMDAGYPVTLVYDVVGIPMGYNVESFKVEVSEDNAFVDSRVFELDADARSISIYHLKTGTKYYYRITMYISDGNEVMVQGNFRTAKTPRLLGIGGVVNMRDFGGWETQSGQIIRQGLLYRGGELDGLYEPEYSITPEGIDIMKNVFGIKTDMDLRHSIPDNPLGDEVEHICYAMAMYSDIFNEKNNEMVRKLFSDLADPEKYPMYIHCTYGMDRTGTVCCLLGAILGMSEDDLIREYELSTAYYGGCNIEAMEQFVADLSKYDGETLMESVETYLISVGVTREEIDSIRTIFLTE